MVAKSSDSKSSVLWGFVLVVVTAAFLFVWFARAARLKEIDKEQAILVAAEGFRVMHHDAAISLSPKNLTWTETGPDKVTIEADGFQQLHNGPVPKRWIVRMLRVDSKWSVESTQWK